MFEFNNNKIVSNNCNKLLNQKINEVHKTFSI